MPNSSKRKGYKLEAELVKHFESWGLKAWRGDGKVGRDVLVKIGDDIFRFECKARGSGSGFKTLARWLEGNDAIYMRADYETGMVTMPIGTLWGLMKSAATFRELEKEGK